MELYIFYIKYNTGKVKTYNKICRKPELTKLYKNLINLLNRDHNNLINTVGYSVASDFRY